MFQSYSSASYIISPRYKLLSILLLIGLLLGVTSFIPQEQFSSRSVLSASVYQAKKPPKNPPHLLSELRTRQSVSQVVLLEIGQKKVTPSPTETPTVQDNAEKPWGVAKQIDEYTWTMKVANDSQMATAQETLSALNAYRQKNGKPALSWDDKLAAYAQSRVETFVSQGQTDKHAGFSDFINNQDGFSKLGFNSVGENSSFGYKLLGVHLIEWVYAGDKPHDDNQLNSAWTHVGIGIKEVATDLIFAGGKR